MDKETPSPADPAPVPGFISRPLWLIVLVGLLVGQGWLTLQLFGPDPWRQLLDDQPILSGRHPLHFYHGLLGAAALTGRGSVSCYDPAFQAGYPKTPVFDSGSRPAELFLGLAGSQAGPAAYKIGFAVCFTLLPLLLAAAGRGIGLAPGPCCLAAALAMVVGWGTPCRTMLQAGDLDLVLAMLAAIVQVGLLLGFHRSPGLLAWVGLLLSGCVGWFSQPLVFPIIILPLLLVYYHSVGVRHCLGWHLALAAGVAGGVAINAFWLIDWVEFWWLRVPLPVGERLLPHRTLQSFWECPLWGGPIDRAVALGVLAAGMAGIIRYAIDRDRPTARLLALAMGGLLALALLGTAWEPLGRLGTASLLVPALWFAILPAMHAAAWLRTGLGSRIGIAPAIAAAATVLVSASWAVGPHLEVLTRRLLASRPLVIGLSDEQRSLIDTLKSTTTSQARILWEDLAPTPSAATDGRDFSHWTVLLPWWTGRLLVGGLDPAATLEHTRINLADGQLAGRPIAGWSDEELLQFCRRYNIGWIVCRSDPAQSRLDALCRTGNAEHTARVSIDGKPADLFTVRRTPSFVLRGQARWLQADWQHIVLGDVQPEAGQVVLSLHYQTGMEVSPADVQIEKDPDWLDPIPFVRLRVNRPVIRLILSWPGS